MAVTSSSILLSAHTVPHSQRLPSGSSELKQQGLSQHSISSESFSSKYLILSETILLCFVKGKESESRSVMSDSLQPHDYTIHGILQARILGCVAFPFSRGSSPGLLHCRWILYQLSHEEVAPFFFQPHGLEPARLFCSWNSPGKSTGVGCHAFLQGNFPTQGSNLGLLHCRQILYCLSHPGSPLFCYGVYYVIFPP